MIGIALSAAAAAGILIWAVLILVVPTVWVAIVAPQATTAVETISAFARLFGALVLFLFPLTRVRPRVQWIAAGFVFLGLGELVFGYSNSVFGAHIGFNADVWGWLTVRTFAFVLFAAGLLAVNPPRLNLVRFGLTALIFAALIATVVSINTGLPKLVGSVNLETAASMNDVPLPGLTNLYWIISTVPLLLALALGYGAWRCVREIGLGYWLLLAFVFMAGSQVHSTLWPSAYGPVLTTGDILRLLFALVVAVGATLALYQIAMERERMLAREREVSRRLTQLGILKANFTSMVAHELTSPVAAVRQIAMMLSEGDGDAREASQAILREIEQVGTLTADVREAGRLEREDYMARPRPIRLATLIEGAAAYARTLPGNHPVHTPPRTTDVVWAEPDRIGQVLRNLLTNAAKYSPPDSPVEILTEVSRERVRVAVKDSGPGIPPEDQTRIFEMFERGKDVAGELIPGIGLGLYISRRIVQGHGSDLKVSSAPGVGATFSFELDRWRPEANATEENGQLVRVLLVEDHSAFRQALASVLQRDAGFVVVGAAGTLAEARKMLAGVDVAVLDYVLPDGKGVDLIPEVRRLNPEAEALVLTALTERSDWAQAVEQGAAGVVHKSAPLDEIVQAVRILADGEYLLSPQEVSELLHEARMAREQRAIEEESIGQLTWREREVLQSLAEGLSDREIADKLHISLATARTHTVSVLGKLGVHSRLQAALLALQYSDALAAPRS